MELNVKKSILKGKIAIPGSKSHTIRAIAMASLADGHSTIGNPLLSSDCVSAVMCYQALGAKINASNHLQWDVTGTGTQLAHTNRPIDVGNSGTTLRIAMGSAALASKNTQIEFTGDKQIRSRPVGPLIDSLNDLGAKVTSLMSNGCAPVTVSGPLVGGRTSIKCITSQYLSSLLLAVPLAEGDSIIDVTLLNEPDYVQITLDWLDKQGIKYENDNFKKFKIPGGQKYKPFDTSIPADFSSATFFLCAGAMLDADITLTGLDYTDSQPDKAVADYLKEMGANITIDDNGTHIKPGKLKGIRIDMNKTPDALPAMAVVACFAEGPTELVNVAQARNKETDRIKCMAEELKKAGADIEELPDGLIIRGGKLHAAKFDGRSDHRIVMALSLLGMAVDGDTSIETAEAINVTFPDYVDLMNSIGAKMIIK
jgi:3-phosphoshikimate 1-carboxyvinyltransferase